MKKVIAIFAIVALASCGSKQESTSVDSTAVKTDSVQVDSTTTNDTLTLADKKAAKVAE